MTDNLTIPTTMYDKDVNGGIPVDMNVTSFPYTVVVKIGINDVNEKSSSLSEERLYPQNTWRGFAQGDITIKGFIDRRLYDKDNIITRELMDSFLKSPNAKLIVNEVNGAKFYDIISVNYKVGVIGDENIRSDVTTTVSSTTSSGSSTLTINSSSGLVAGLIVKVYSSGSSGDYELCEIESIDGNTLTLKTNTIMSHSAGASVKYYASQSCPFYEYDMKLTRSRNPSTY